MRTDGNLGATTTDVDIELIDRPEQKPWGVGESAAAVVPTAISNAVFDAVGVRLRSVPFLPEKALAALKEPVSKERT